MWGLMIVGGVLLAGALDRPTLAVTVNDGDADGCSDGEELEPNPTAGGGRDPELFWDFFDVPTPPALTRDKAIAISDIVAVVARFGSSGSAAGNPLSPPPPAPGYHTGYDRTPPGVNPGGVPQGPNGSVTVQDITVNVGQFGHTCAGPEVVGIWTMGATMPTARTEVTSAAIGDVIYVIGGFLASATPTNLVEAYDTGGNSWTTPAPYPTTLHHATAVTAGGRLFVIGGYVSSFTSWTTAVYEYDPVADDWTARAPMPQARAAAAVVEVGGIIYVLGGTGPKPGQAASPPMQGYAYNPTTNTWSSALAPMPAGHEHLTASVAGGKIYVVGGRHNVTQNDNFTHVYDPVANTWGSLAPMPTARGGLTSWSMAGRIHVVGGENLAPGGSTYPQHQVYNPATNTWQPGPPLPTPRHGLTAQVAGSKAYVIGGGPTPNLSVSGAVEAFELK